jgi:hypothetical protein
VERANLSRDSAMIDDRIIKDSSGLEWEVFDESTPDVRLALECDYRPQQDDPGLLFISREGRRRLYPCPTGWRHLPDDALERLCTKARVLY